MPEVKRHSALSILTLTDSVTLVMVPEEKGLSWMRWIHASINKHFLDNKGPLPMYLEGDERTLQEETEFYELRIDGPFITQPHKNFWYCDVEINVLVQSHMNMSELYRLQEAVSPIVKAFTNAICVYKYGEGALDDGTLFGTLRLRPELDETIDVNYYGIIKEDTRLTQATIEGHYRMEID